MMTRDWEGRRVDTTSISMTSNGVACRTDSTSTMSPAARPLTMSRMNPAVMKSDRRARVGGRLHRDIARLEEDEA